MDKKTLFSAKQRHNSTENICKIAYEAENDYLFFMRRFMRHSVFRPYLHTNTAL